MKTISTRKLSTHFQWTDTLKLSALLTLPSQENTTFLQQVPLAAERQCSCRASCLPLHQNSRRKKLSLLAVSQASRASILLTGISIFLRSVCLTRQHQSKESAEEVLTAALAKYPLPTMALSSLMKPPNSVRQFFRCSEFRLKPSRLH